jgi:DNA-directed RNA polymerase subunit RPC12/RpoP
MFVSAKYYVCVDCGRGYWQGAVADLVTRAVRCAGCFRKWLATAASGRSA